MEDSGPEPREDGHERADDAYENWEPARRRHAQLIDEWIRYLKQVWMELETQAATVAISGKQYASRMLRGSKGAGGGACTSIAQLRWNLRSGKAGKGV